MTRPNTANAGPTVRQDRIKPIVIEVAMRHAFHRALRNHNVPNAETITDEVLQDLLGSRVWNPPEGIPSVLTIEGVQLEWPQGLSTRAVTQQEIVLYNKALARCKAHDRIDAEDNVRILRECFETLAIRVREQAPKEATPRPVPKPPAVRPVSPDLQGVSELDVLAAELAGMRANA